MNVSFKTIRRSGDKLYSLGDFRLRRTSSCGAFSINGNGRLIPSDTFPIAT